MYAACIAPFALSEAVWCRWNRLSRKELLWGSSQELGKGQRQSRSAGGPGVAVYRSRIDLMSEAPIVPLLLLLRLRVVATGLLHQRRQ